MKGVWKSENSFIKVKQLNSDLFSIHTLKNGIIAGISKITHSQRWVADP